MTDRSGLFEHARGPVPRPEHGYCTDDAGRALALTCDFDDPEADRLSGVYLAFLQRMALGGGRFTLRAGHDPRVTVSGVSDDACGRAILGLGVAAARATNDTLAHAAAELFDSAVGFRSPWLRAAAYAALGGAEVLARHPDHPGAATLVERAASMVVSATGPRNWPEPHLRYANALLPECLLAAAKVLNSTAFERSGLRLLDWLVRVETTAVQHFSFTPNSGRSGAAGDQQPIEAGAMADAATRAFALTGDSYWVEVTVRAAEWFTGRNDFGVPMFDEGTGGCFDGLGADGPNLNQGAESTIAFLSALRRAHAVMAAPSEVSSL